MCVLEILDVCALVLQQGLVTAFILCEWIAQMCHFLPLICFFGFLHLLIGPFSVVRNLFNSSNSAAGVFNKKSDRGGQQTKLSTTLCRLKWCWKFAHCLHRVESDGSALKSETGLFVFAASVIARIKLYLRVMIK